MYVGGARTCKHTQFPHFKSELYERLLSIYNRSELFIAIQEGDPINLELIYKMQVVARAEEQY